MMMMMMMEMRSLAFGNPPRERVVVVTAMRVFMGNKRVGMASRECWRVDS